MNLNAAGKAAGLILNMLDTAKPTKPPVEFRPQKPLLERSGARFFARVSPEECGIPHSLCIEYVRALAENKEVGLQTIMLLRGDRVFFEAAAGDNSLQIHKSTFSECKSVVSLCIGRLITEGLLSLDERLADIFAAKTPAVSMLRFKNVTVRDLLKMTAAVEFNELEAVVSTDWIKGYMSSSLVGEPGKTFYYNSLNSYMLAAVVKEKTGMSLTGFLDSGIFGELGITDYFWETCPQGNAKGGWGLYILPEDTAKLGLLVLNGGVWNGKRLISEDYINEATSTQAIAPRSYGDYNYGYHFWCGRTVNSFLMNGMLGQNLLCFRDSGVTAVINCCNGDNFQQNDFFKITAKYLNRSFPDSLPEDAQGAEEISRFKKELAEKDYSLPIKKIWCSQTKKPDFCECAKKLDKKRFRAVSGNAASTGFEPLFMQMVQNNYVKGLREIAFDFSGGMLNVRFIEADGEYAVSVREGAAENGIADFRGEPFIVSSRADFCENEDGVPVFVLKCEFPETPYKREFKFLFGDEIYLNVSEKPGREYSRVVPELMRTMAKQNQLAGSLLSKIDDEHITALLEYAFEPEILLKEIKN